MTPRVALLLAAIVAFSGCHRKQITQLERDEAANLVSEADFAGTVKEWDRAEGLYAKAAGLCPDSGDIWFDLGIARMRQSNHDGARSAFTSALSAYKDDLSREPGNAAPVIRAAYVLVILGRADDARSLAQKAQSKNPDDRALRDFVQNNGVDALLRDPGLKSLSP